ncbi:MAG TPA: hypothetical protein VG498_10680 [Terriglobales bacterium]|nr:hypothetical protein [Terriglobales bacterium]
MNTTTIPGHCPICSGTPLKPLPLSYAVAVTVMKDGRKQHVGGLVAYVCTQRGHVCFVMAKDIQAVTDAPVLEEGTA